MQRCKTLTAPISKTSKCTSPLGLTVAVLAERALHDGVQCHEAHVFKQFKSLIGVCVRLPFVLVGKNWCHISGRRLKKNKNLWPTQNAYRAFISPWPPLSVTTTPLFTYQHDISRIWHQCYVGLQNIIMESWSQEPPVPEPLLVFGNQ